MLQHFYQFFSEKMTETPLSRKEKHQVVGYPRTSFYKMCDNINLKKGTNETYSTIGKKQEGVFMSMSNAWRFCSENTSSGKPNIVIFSPHYLYFFSAHSTRPETYFAFLSLSQSRRAYFSIVPFAISETFVMFADNAISAGA